MTNGCRARSTGPDRLEARAWTVVALALLIYLATQVDHTLTALAFAVGTSGAILMTPQIIEALAPRQARTAVVSKSFRRLLLAVGVVGAGFVILGMLEGELKVPSSAGQSHFLIGVAILTFVAILGPVLQWLQLSTTDIVATMSDEGKTRLRTKLEQAEIKRWWTSLGAVLVVAGIVLQFIAITRG